MSQTNKLRASANFFFAATVIVIAAAMFLTFVLPRIVPVVIAAETPEATPAVEYVDRDVYYYSGEEDVLPNNFGPNQEILALSFGITDEPAALNAAYIDQQRWQIDPRMTQEEIDAMPEYYNGKGADPHLAAWWILNRDNDPVNKADRLYTPFVPQDRLDSMVGEIYADCQSDVDRLHIYLLHNRDFWDLAVDHYIAEKRVAVEKPPESWSITPIASYLWQGYCVWDGLDGDKPRAVRASGGNSGGDDWKVVYPNGSVERLRPQCDFQPIDTGIPELPEIPEVPSTPPPPPPPPPSGGKNPELIPTPSRPGDGGPGATQPGDNIGPPTPPAVPKPPANPTNPAQPAPVNPPPPPVVVPDPGSKPAPPAPTPPPEAGVNPTPPPDSGPSDPPPANEDKPAKPAPPPA